MAEGKPGRPRLPDHLLSARGLRRRRQKQSGAVIGYLDVRSDHLDGRPDLRKRDPLLERLIAVLSKGRAADGSRRVRVPRAFGRDISGASTAFLGGENPVAVIRFSDHQLEQISAMATQIPRRLRDAYLQRVAQLLNGRDFGDGDVHRAARAAAGEIMHGPGPALAGRGAVNRKESRA